MRAAVYYAPDPGDPLWQAGIGWLGWDPARGEAVEQPAFAGIGPATGAPRRYGFHATVKPPMRLRFGLAAMIDALREVLRDVAPFEMPALAVSRIDGFIALTEVTRCAALQSLADLCVTRMDGHREPEAEEAVARRKAGLDAHGQELVARYGYGQVLDRWRFHMTLSERLEEADELAAAAARYFAGALAVRRRVEGLAVFVEDEPGAAFRLVARVGMGGVRER